MDITVPQLMSQASKPLLWGTLTHRIAVGDGCFKQMPARMVEISNADGDR